MTAAGRQANEGADGERIIAALPRLIADVARETSSALVASRIATLFVVALRARTAHVYVKGVDHRTLHLVAAKNVDAATMARLHTVDLHDVLPAAVAARVGLLQLIDADDASSFGQAKGAIAMAYPGSGVVLALPLFAGAATIGAISAGFDELSLADCSALALLSHSLGALVEGARLRLEVEQLRLSELKRSERAAFVVHELRQPLNLMAMSAASLSSRSAGIERRSLEILRASVRRLDGLVADLGDASLIESGRFTLRVADTDVVALVQAAVTRNVPAARVVIDGDVPRIDVDPERVEQVLTNLLVNALKYGKAETAPRIDVACRGSAVVISVTNEGNVIPDSERVMIFEPYYRALGRRPGATGLGLGLHICRKLVEEHGGRIWTDVDAAQTRFSFSLPISRSAPTPLIEPAAPVAAPLS